MKSLLAILAAVLMLSSIALPQTPQPKSSSEWEDFGFLLGEWTAGESSGVPGSASQGWFTLAPDLGGKVLVRKNHAEYPPANGRPGIVHDDLMIIYREGSATKAFYDDNEGHAIHYDVTVSPDKKRIVFVSEKSRPGPQFRLTYENVQPGTAKVVFEMAAPDKPDQFTRYVEAMVRRKS